MVKEEPNGLMIGSISNGMVHIKWMQHMHYVFKSIPGGVIWNFIYRIGDFKKDPTKSYASLRTEIVEKALEQNYKWLLFVDTDVFIPVDAISRMLTHNKDIVTGIYWMKKYPPQPVVYKNFGDGPIWDIQIQDELLEVAGAGLGACLINLDVFRKFKKKRKPFFKQDWTYKKNGRLIRVAIGEDHWFFHKARELGYKVYADTNILCDHLDNDSGIFYPGEEVVRKITEKRIKELQKSDKKFKKKGVKK